jgi:hypothetical protein
MCTGRYLNCGKTKLGCFAPRQSAGSRFAPHPQLSGKTTDICCAPSTLFSGLSPAEFFLFPKLKNTLKECRFQTIEEFRENAIRELRAITSSAFLEAFQQCKKCRERFIASRGDYVEGDGA